MNNETVLAAHQNEIEERFTERGYFARLRDLFNGLGKPHGTREYKTAVLELQRLKAPVIGTLVPVLGVIVLIVVTAVQNAAREGITIDIPKPVEDVVLEPDPEPQPDPEPHEPPEEPPTVTVDAPAVAQFTDFVNPTPVPCEQQSVKPSEVDAVALIKSPVTMRSVFSGRETGSIGANTSGGPLIGDSSTEHAVMKALRWLKVTQATDGSWAGGNNRLSNTALAVLCYLAHNETPRSEEFGETVERALKYLIDCETEKGGKVTFTGTDGNEYATLIATYALGEAFGMTGNPEARDAAMAALKRIVANQSPTGGWDYKLNRESSRDDMSYAGWALQALKACKLAGLHPEGLDECIKKAVRCLEQRNFRNGGFNYTAGGNPTGLTATGCLAMQLLGFGDRPAVSESLSTMREWLPTFDKAELRIGGKSAGVCPQYYCYYASQCKYQAGMRQGAVPEDVKSWQNWNAAMKKLYPTSIKTETGKYSFKGKDLAIGHWTNEDVHGGKSATTMPTCLCALQLMVYYRYLPTTQAEGGRVARAAPKKSRTDEIAVDVDI